MGPFMTVMIVVSSYLPPPCEIQTNMYISDQISVEEHVVVVFSVLQHNKRQIETNKHSHRTL